MIQKLTFRPLPGLSSPHIQTIAACLSRSGLPPPSIPFIVPLEDGDALWCAMSTPSSWHSQQKTIILVHGLSGSHESNYMIRMSRKFYEDGCCVVRMNLRGCSHGHQLASRPYHAGTSQDVLSVIRAVKQQKPHSPISLIGFSLGGNIVLKLAGELGKEGSRLLQRTIAVCPPIDLKQTHDIMDQVSNRFYHLYYLKNIKQQTRSWIGKKVIRSMYEYDNAVIAPLWGFRDAKDYYQQCSSSSYLSDVSHSCTILFAEDDPFIDYRAVLKKPISSFVKIATTRYGGHLGFLGWTNVKHRLFWLDHYLHAEIHSNS